MPLQLRDSLVKDDLRVPIDPGAHTLLHQPNPRLEKNLPLWGWHSPWGIPWQPTSTSNFMLCQAGGDLGHHCHPENHSPTVFCLQHRKVGVLACPAGGFISVLGLFGPSAALGHTTILMTCDSMSPSVGAPISTTQHDDFRAHPQVFIPSPADNLLLSGAQE